MARQRRPVRSAAMICEPVPLNGSNTMSATFVCFLIPLLGPDPARQGSMAGRCSGRASRLVGISSYHQMMPIELDPAGKWTAITATNSLRLTAGQIHRRGLVSG
jgi:hypothetical protein